MLAKRTLRTRRLKAIRNQLERIQRIIEMAGLSPPKFVSRSSSLILLGILFVCAKPLSNYTFIMEDKH